MRRSRWLALAALPALAAASVAIAAEASSNFGASLKGANEVPPIETRGAGNVVLRLSGDESSLDFKLFASNIDGVTQAHIHCGAEGVNGPIVVFLFGFDPAGVAPNGILSQGTIDAGDVIPRPDSAACPGGVAVLADVVERLRSGDAYVNVHTLVNQGGEIRGQVRERGPGG